GTGAGLTEISGIPAYNPKNGNKFAAQGLQIVAGVPLHCDEPADFKTFRVGLFGLDKLGNMGFGEQGPNWLWQTTCHVPNFSRQMRNT
ncbi:hypothetical protein ACW9HT_28815, partial [Pseudomonas sp. SDO5201_S390]